ncbi:hypothetical protein E2L06_01295 [Haloterrigena sp. H1]|uniref:DUF7123 family protein n=1 Tax=Haloterrigena sp. H1 TaxID=2552943 RepID=UPI00110F1C3B|nr:hypothetical protein [Haloterrigena sp. H1]TMT87885.1 hypothetical protein E2L06_01295 [Haloterrigena sp. H1]
MGIQTNHTGISTEKNLTEKQYRILAYLRNHTTDQAYFKSRCIANDLGLTPKEVGTNIPAIQQADTKLEIEKWGYSSSTTWMVTA